MPSKTDGSVQRQTQTVVSKMIFLVKVMQSVHFSNASKRQTNETTLTVKISGTVTIGQLSLPLNFRLFANCLIFLLVGNLLSI